MCQLPHGGPDKDCRTNGAQRNYFVPRSLDIMPRVYFRGKQDMNVFVLNFDDYFSYIQDKKRYLLKCSWCCTVMVGEYSKIFGKRRDPAIRRNDCKT